MSISTESAGLRMSVDDLLGQCRSTPEHAYDEDRGLVKTVRSRQFRERLIAEDLLGRLSLGAGHLDVPAALGKGIGLLIIRRGLFKIAGAFGGQCGGEPKRPPMFLIEILARKMPFGDGSGGFELLEPNQGPGLHDRQ